MNEFCLMNVLLSVVHSETVDLICKIRSSTYIAKKGMKLSLDRSLIKFCVGEAWVKKCTFKHVSEEM